jgi:hypothetical protein
LTAIVLLLTAALCAHQASTRGWGDALGADSTLYRLAPNGIVHLAADGSTLESCRWFPLHGTNPLCQAASGAEHRFQRLTYAYPALQSGAWLSFLAMLVLTLAGPQASRLTRTLAFLATLGSLLGIALVVSGAPTGAAALAGLSFKFGGTGLVLAVIAPVGALAAGLLVPSTRARAG